MTMTSRTKTLVGILIPAVVFLLGYLPATLQSRGFQRDLMTTQPARLLLKGVLR
jgi:hypothetical protein